MKIKFYPTWTMFLAALSGEMSHFYLLYLNFRAKMSQENLFFIGRDTLETTVYPRIHLDINAAVNSIKSAFTWPNFL